MVELTRRVRFCVGFFDPPPEPDPGPTANTFAGWPAMSSLGAYYEIDVTCRGEPDPVTGYLMNISSIDRAVRETAVPLVQRSILGDAPVEPGLVLRDVTEQVARRLDGRVTGVRWSLTPYHAISMESAVRDRVTISQQFDFAAAHRLHCPTLSDEENRAVFGRCNNPNGHGHNYRLEVAVSTPLLDRGPELAAATLESIVMRTVIERFDHTHLNLDTEEFRDVNPSVEHIARVCHRLLESPVETSGGRLERVTIWETEKTSCTYPAS